MNKASDVAAVDLPEIVEEENQKPWNQPAQKGVDRAAQLMGNQQVELTEEDVSDNLLY